MTPGIEQLTCRHRNIFSASKNLSILFLNNLGGSSYDQLLPFGTEKSKIFRLQYKKDISTIIEKYSKINFIKSKPIDKY